MTRGVSILRRMAALAVGTGRAEAVVEITCPKPAGRKCWVATEETVPTIATRLL